jgi:hypothetical protein
MATMEWQLLLGEADAAAATWDDRSLCDTLGGVKRVVAKTTTARFARAERAAARQRAR